MRNHIQSFHRSVDRQARPSTRVNRFNGALTVLAVLLIGLLTFAMNTGQTHATVSEGGWQPIGPEGGAVNDLAIDPATPTKFYAATDGGVFKSTDSGATWSHTSVGLTNPTVYDVDIDPVTPDTLYAGTNGGVFKSTDGGATWSESKEGLPNNLVYRVAIDPNAPSTLYAGTWGGGLFKSTDGGANWSQIGADVATFASGQIYVVTTVATTPTTIYVGIGEGSAGMYKSTDGGSTWTQINNGLTNTRMRTLAVHPTDLNTIYVGTSGGGVFKSMDSGASWSQVSNGLNSSARYTADLAIDPTAPDTLYLGTFTEGVQKSTDGSANWSPINAGLPTLPPPSSHPWTNAVAVNPTTPSTVYVGMETGLYRSTDGGDTWAGFNDGLTATGVYAIQVNPTMTTTLYAGTSGSGVFKSTNGGETWGPVNTGLPNLFVRVLVLDPTAPDTLYIGTGGWGVFKSTDGGANWTEINEGIHFNPGIGAIAVDPITPSTVYVGSNQGIYKSTDGGVNWSKLSGGPSGMVNALVIDPNTSSTLYAGERGIHKSTDGGATWSAINNGLLWDQASITALAIDPTNPSTLYVGFYAGVYKTTDGGANWSAANSGQSFASIQSLAIDPNTPTTLYAGASGTGAFMSTDGGANWNVVNDGLGNLWVHALAVNPGATDTVYAGTFVSIFQGTDLMPPAEPFALTNRGPAVNAVGVSLSQNITATFDAELNAGTVTTQTFRARSDLRGVLNGAFTVDGSSLTFDPAQDFVMGEQVQVMATSDIQSVDGRSLTPTQWTFTPGLVTARCVEGFTDTGASLTNISFGSVGWADYDGDGDLDILLSGGTVGDADATVIHRNDGGGVFTDIGAGLLGLKWGSAAWGDYDNDGDPDLIVTGTEGATNTNNSTPVTRLYRNDGGSFVQVNSGIANYWQSGVAWGDYDNDGDLDLVLAGRGNNARIYRNDGNETFTDISAGLPTFLTASVDWGDIDNDSDLDLLITGELGGAFVSRVYRNDDGVFTDMNAGLTGVKRGSAKFGDYDNDGYLDILLTGETVVFAVGSTAQIYRNVNGTSFSDIGANLAGALNSSAAWGDYDNDGDLDILYAGASGVTSRASRIYRNDGGVFTLVNAGLIAPNYASVAWGDYDNDGDLDILMSGFLPGPGSTTRLYRNDDCPPITDGNGDGIADNQQANVETIVSNTGNRVTLAAPNGITLQNVERVQPSTPAPQGVALPQGLIGFDAAGISAGGSFSITLIIQEGPIATSYWKYGPTPTNTTDHWYEFLYDGTTGAVISGRTITLYFVDGVRGDSDLTANGVITDPGGPAGAVLSEFIYLPAVQR